MKLRTIILVTLISLTLAACNFTLAEDVTPPPNYIPPTPPPTIGPLNPATAPDLVVGEAIYIDKCLPCHGEKGFGDGPQNKELPVSVAPIGMADTVQAVVPSDWYTIVSRGNIDRFMPPFTSLSEQERWDVIGYVYNLSIEPEELETGKTHYAENCAECHGDDGEGGIGRAFTDQVYMAQTSNQGLYLAITTGIPDRMPGFANEITEADRWALATYVRTLSFATETRMMSTPKATTNSDPAAATPTLETNQTPEPGETPDVEVTPTEEVTSTEEPSIEATPDNVDQVAYLGTFTGTLINGSGGDTPSGLTVTLRGFDPDMSTGGFTEMITIEQAVETDNTFTFNGVELQPNRAFIVTLEISDAEYISEPAFMAEDTATMETEGFEFELPVTFYDTSSDASQLAVDRMHIFLEFTSPGIVDIVEVYIISNPSVYTIAPGSTGQPVVNFALPEGAIHLQFDDGVLGDRYVQTENGFGDLQPIPPSIGEHQVVAIYALPYEKKLDFSHLLTFNTSAVQIIVPNGVKIKSDLISGSEQRDMQGTVYTIYNTGNIPANSEFNITISGQPDDSTETGVDTRQGLLIGAGVLGIVLIVAGAWLFWRDRQSGEDDDYDEGEFTSASIDTSEDAMDAIIALDDQYRAGLLPKDIYQKRRAELKSRLKDLL